MKKKKRTSLVATAPIKPFVPLDSVEFKAITAKEYEQNRLKAYLPLGFVRVESDHATHFYLNHKSNPVYCFIQLYDPDSQSFIVTNQYEADVLIHCSSLHACLEPRKFNINPKTEK